MNQTAIYIHIPFCDHKCIYCDFYSIINHENTSNYLSALKREIDFYAQKFSLDRKIISIFFGGGTPSLMEPSYIQEIIHTVKNKFSVNDNTEITLETNPGTVDKEKLAAFKAAGINRLSVGIQSFDEEDLKFLTRIHNSATAIKTIEEASLVGFNNISLDLIFNLPGQSKIKWQKNLEQALKLPVTHISAYSLILERGTILNKMVLDGKVKIEDEEHDAALYEQTIQFFTSNEFEQYEVSNFAKRGFECVHNNAYWRYIPYLSFGTSAHSFANGKRWWNLSSAKFYIEAINKKGNAVAGQEVLTKNEMLNEYVMLAFRSKGLDLTELEKLFGNDWIASNNKILQNFIEEEYIIKKGALLSLTLKGYVLCDELLSRFIS